MTRSSIWRLGVIALAVAAAPTASAAEWKTTAALYGWGTWIDGDASYGPLDLAVDVDAGQVVDSLELGAMARVRSETDRWAIVFDGIYASLGGTKEGPPRLALDLNQYVLQLDAAYRLGGVWEVLAGVRYARFETTLDVGGNGPAAIHREGDASFVDPVVGLRAIAPLSDRWRLQTQVDAGGGVDMDFTWQGMLNVGYRAGERATLWLGYRAIGMDFDDAGGAERFGMDTTMHGPVAGLAFGF